MANRDSKTSAALMEGQDNTMQRATNGIVEFFKTVVFALALAVVLRSLVFSPFNIPSSSMVPTLLVGDYLFVSKFAYGYSKHSFPFSPPMFEGRIFATAPKRGDVVVFKLPTDNSTDYIKRLIGMPGDRIQVIDSVVYINGEPLRRERLDQITEVEGRGIPDRVVRFRETMPNGVSYITYDHEPGGPLSNTGVYVVPEGHYFMMGDNRDNSQDSRVLSAVGYVPAENLVGRGEIIFYSTSSRGAPWEVWDWIPATRPSRIGTLLH